MYIRRHNACVKTRAEAINELAKTCVAFRGCGAEGCDEPPAAVEVSVAL